MEVVKKIGLERKPCRSRTCNKFKYTSWTPTKISHVQLKAEWLLKLLLY